MSKFSLIGVVTFTALNLAWVRAEFFSATSNIKDLLDTHQSVIDELEQYVVKETKKVNILSKYLSNFKREHTRMKDKMDYVGNPINTYTLIKRLTLDLNTIEYYVKLKHAFKRNEGMLFPNKEDLDGAAGGLLRLQRMYLLNTSMLAAGRLEGNYSHNKKRYVEITSPMSGSDCFEVGRVMYEQEEYQSAVSWMTEALNKYHSSDSSGTPFDVSYIDYLRHAYHGIGDFQKAIRYTHMLAELRPDLDYTKNLQEYENLSKQVDYKPVIHSEYPDYAYLSPTKYEKYKSLCRGDIPFPENKRKSLFCYYKSNSDFLRLAPIRVELLHREPEIYLFHDVISDPEIQHIQQLAQPMLQRARVREHAKQSVSTYRVSKTAWLTDKNSTVARLSRRVEDFSGLSTKYAELLQVANYGVGGHYDPHFDFNMSDVEQGGATVFVDLGLTVYPIKNSAIVWTNFLRSGEPDYRTLHASCPVLRGSKWAANKWIHNLGQEFLQPCNLEFEENKSQFPK